MNKKAIELALNTVIMLIIGLVLFGLGISLFSQIAGSGNDQIDQMRVEVIDSLAGLECNSQEWLCIPSTKIEQGESKTISVYITNLGDTESSFSIKLDSTSPSITNPYNNNANAYGLEKSDCGNIILTPFPSSTPIGRGEVAKIPMHVQTNTVSKACSFTTTLTIESTSPTGSTTAAGNGEKAPVIIQVE